MGRAVIIYGESGSGKSRSLKNFGEDEILLINVEGKDLPFRKKFKYTLSSDNYQMIQEQLKKMPLKIAVIDDAGYLMTNEFMYGHRNFRGNSVFELYNDIADHFWGLLKMIQNELPPDVIVYVVMHEETNDYSRTKLKTIGKMLDEKVNISGMTTIQLRCRSDAGRHFFQTQTDSSDVTKSPEDMLEREMDNDLKLVDTKIREYYNFGGTEQ